jgi:WD40 repeat protein
MAVLLQRSIQQHKSLFDTTMARLSELAQDMEETLTKFLDIPAIVIASNVFPYFDNRTDWNNFSVANKDIYKAVTSHKQLAPPWPEGKLIQCDNSRSPAFSRDGKCIAHGDNEGNLYLWNTKGLVAKWQGYDQVDNDDDDDDEEDDSDDEEEEICVDNVIFSPAGDLLVSVGTIGNDSIIKIWDLANDHCCLREWTQTHINSVSFSPDGKCIATAAIDFSPVCLRNVSDGTTASLIRHDDFDDLNFKCVCAVTFSPDGQTLAVGGSTEHGNASVELWNLDSEEESFTNLEVQGGTVIDLAYSPNGAFLVVADIEGSIKVWDIATNRCVQILKGNTDGVFSTSFTPDGNFVVSGGSDRSIRMWCLTNTSTNTDSNCIEIIQPGVVVTEVEFSQCGQMLLSNEGSSIRLRRMDKCMLASLKEDFEDLMKLTHDHLQQALTENNIPFLMSYTRFALIDLFVDGLDQNQRKAIVARFIKGGLPSPSSEGPASFGLLSI